MPGVPQLLERADPLGRLRRRIEAAAAGRGSVCLVEGPAGVGKTALLAAAGTAAAGFAVLAATAGPLEGDLTWSLVRQVFAGVIDGSDAASDVLLSGAAALAAAPLGLAERRAESGALHGLYWLAAGLSQRSPLLISVDDAHWGDEPSLRFLAYLAERLEDLPVVLAVTVRSGEERPEPLLALAAHPGAEVIGLRELSPEASAELARAELGPLAATEFCAACHRATNGNPFLLHELLAELRREGVETTVEGAAEVDDVTPESVGRAVLLRLSRMPEAAGDLASAVAVLGSGARLAEAAALAGLDRDLAASAADSLAAAAILSPTQELEFAHPLVGDVIYGELPVHVRGRLHRRAAQILDEAGLGPSRVGAQLLETDAGADPWTVARLREAAAEALAEEAPEPAARLLERALAEPPPRGDRVDLLIELAEAEAAAGDHGAVERLREAFSLATEPAQRAGISLALGRALYTDGAAAEAAEALEDGRRVLAESGKGNGFLATALEAAWLAVARVDVGRRPEAVRAMRLLAERDPVAETYADRALLAQVAGQLTFDAEPRERPLRLAELALGDGQLLREESADGLAWPVVAGVLGWCDEFDTCEALCAAAIEDARRRGSASGFATASFAIGVVRYFRGRLADSRADSGQAIAAAAEGWSQFLVAARALQSLALLEQGRYDDAEAQIAAAADDPGWSDTTMRALVLEAQARLHLARRRPAEALAAALNAGRLCRQVEMANPSVCAWRPSAAVAAARLGDSEQAEELAEEGLMLARRCGTPRALGIALCALGATRKGAARLEAFEEATTILAGGPAHLEEARALVLRGSALRRSGRLKAAREVLRAGLDRAATIGASVLEERARSELRSSGGRPRRRRLSGAEALTPAELRVAELAADGQTNREVAESLFVSLRTVETHLTRVYRKLGIESRAQLPAALSTPAGPTGSSRPRR